MGDEYFRMFAIHGDARKWNHVVGAAAAAAVVIAVMVFLFVHMSVSVCVCVHINSYVLNMWPISYTLDAIIPTNHTHSLLHLCNIYASPTTSSFVFRVPPFETTTHRLHTTHQEPGVWRCEFLANSLWATFSLTHSLSLALPPTFVPLNVRGPVCMLACWLVGFVRYSPDFFYQLNLGGY